MRKIIIALAVAGTLLGFQGCRTTEANYRQAYEKAKAGQAEVLELDSTIYGRVRRDLRTITVKSADGTEVEVKNQLVRVTENGGGIPENLKEYNVVVAQFKQLFNAMSMRTRLVDEGFPEAFVVQTAEPYYYVVAASRADVSQAVKALESFMKSNRLPLKEPCPFILKATRR